MNTQIIIFTFFVILLQGCGGGGDAGSSNPSVPLDPLPVKDTSYKNYKEVGLTPQNLPGNRSGDGPIRTYADFTRSGRLDMFVVVFNSPWPPTTLEDQNPSIMEFWQKQADGSFILRDDLLKNPNDGCTHPRKAIVADFNQDGVPDVFVVCHGFDADPFPGEKNKVILSQSDGKFLIQNASDDVGFFHGASAADLNGDNYPDVLVVDNNDRDKLYVLLNNTDGSFRRETTERLPYSLINNGNYYTVELVDINSDNFVDALLGGHEHENAETLLLVNDGDNYFITTPPTAIPSVPDSSTVLDFAVTVQESNRYIWVNRTNINYGSRVIQKVSWPDLTSSVPLNENPKQWLLWILPTIVNNQNVIATDDASFGTLLNY